MPRITTGLVFVILAFVAVMYWIQRDTALTRATTCATTCNASPSFRECFDACSR